LVLYVITGQLIGTLAITVTAALAEAYGLEDNLAIPIATSLIAMALGMPIIT